MTYYEAIKKMSVKEITLIFFMFVEPFMNVLGATAEDKKKHKQQIEEFLKKEIEVPRKKDN